MKRYSLDKMSAFLVSKMYFYKLSLQQNGSCNQFKPSWLLYCKNRYIQNKLSLKMLGIINGPNQLSCIQNQSKDKKKHAYTCLQFSSVRIYFSYQY